MSPVQASQTSSLSELLERVLDQGIVISGDLDRKPAAIELLAIQVTLLMACVEKAREPGMDGREPGLDGLEPGLDGLEPGLDGPVCPLESQPRAAAAQPLAAAPVSPRSGDSHGEISTG